MKIISFLVVGFCVFLVCILGWFGGAIRKRSKAEPGLRLVRANGLIARQKYFTHGGDDSEIN